MNDWSLEEKRRVRDDADRLIQTHGFGIIAEELYDDIAASNATGCTFVFMTLPETPQAGLAITDDASERFRDLNHVRTIYAQKHLLAFCTEATISTTKGTVVFDERGVENLPRRRTNRGTMLTATLDCTPEQYEQFVEYLRRLNPKPGLRVFINGEEVRVESRKAT